MSNDELWIVVVIEADGHSHTGPFRTDVEAEAWARAKFDPIGFEDWYVINMERPLRCVLCDDIVHGFGHNPAPVIDVGQCCDTCNAIEVIPARMKQGL